ncbi:MAG TPA: 6-carboxytetrahydropterin synthase, partial [Gemmatimonadaceae bacterium]
KRLVESTVVDQMDHHNMNVDVPFMQGVNPTTENIVVAIWRQLEPAVGRGETRLVRLRLWETENNYVEYAGE